MTDAKPFSLHIEPDTVVSGVVRWGDRGWLVVIDGQSFQAPPEMGVTEAVLTALRTRLIDGSGCAS